MTKKGKKQLPAQVENPLHPDYLLFCEHVLFSYEKNVLTFTNLIDVVAADAIPHRLSRFWIIAAFLRNPKLNVEQLKEFEISHQIKLTGPSGKEFDVDEFPLNVTKNTRSFVYRVVCDLSEGITLEAPGLYYFSVYQKSKDKESELVLQRPLPVYIKKPKDLAHIEH